MKRLIEKAGKVPTAAWIIVASGILVLLVALSVKVLFSDHVTLGKTGLTIDELAAASDAKVADPESVKAVADAIATAPAPEVKEKLQVVQERQRRVQQQQQQQQQQGPHRAVKGE